MPHTTVKHEHKLMSVITRAGLTVSLSAAATYLFAAQSQSENITNGRSLPFHDTQAEVEAAQSSDKVDCLVLVQHRDGPILYTSLRSDCKAPVAIRGVVALSSKHDFPAESKLYGEGFTMLAGTVGTLGKPEHLSPYTDPEHYKLAEPAGAQTYYGVAMLSPPGRQSLILGFLSAKHYVGTVNLWEGRFTLNYDTEGLAIQPGETWTFDPAYISWAKTGRGALAAFGRAVARANGARARADVKTGWSSWNAFRNTVTFSDVVSTARVASTSVPSLEYIQLDDGYQAAWGDWLTTRPDFGGNIEDLARTIRQLGKKPALWLAPLVAERSSDIFKTHPDWFIKDDSGAPLASDRVSFGGWYHSPWYCLDGTNPEVQAYLERLFRTMHKKWGVNYFKLDALFWGAIQGGHFHDLKATRIESYRLALAAIRRGTGDSFITIANAPQWPSIGFGDASRTSNDVAYDWPSFREVAKSNLYRAWMHRVFWLNDADSIMLGGKASENELRFHWTASYIAGGNFFSGDDLAKLPRERLQIMNRLGKPEGFVPVSKDGDLSFIDTAVGPKAVFNWDDAEKTLTITGPGNSRWKDVWSGKIVHFKADGKAVLNVASHDALLLRRIPSGQ